eukprot:1490898-Rhodomonas_salina.1
MSLEGGGVVCGSPCCCSVSAGGGLREAMSTHCARHSVRLPFSTRCRVYPARHWNGQSASTLLVQMALAGRPVHCVHCSLRCPAVLSWRAGYCPWAHGSHGSQEGGSFCTWR